MAFFGHKVVEDCFCEIPGCGSPCIDVHHVIPRSKFGSKRKDEQDHITNLIGLCRPHHDSAHANILTKEYLLQLTNKRSNAPVAEYVSKNK